MFLLKAKIESIPLLKYRYSCKVSKVKLNEHKIILIKHAFPCKVKPFHLKIWILVSIISWNNKHLKMRRIQIRNI